MGKEDAAQRKGLVLRGAASPDATKEEPPLVNLEKRKVFDSWTAGGVDHFRRGRGRPRWCGHRPKEKTGVGAPGER